MKSIEEDLKELKLTQDDAYDRDIIKRQTHYKMDKMTKNEESRKKSNMKRHCHSSVTHDWLTAEYRIQDLKYCFFKRFWEEKWKKKYDTYYSWFIYLSFKYYRTAQIWVSSLQSSCVQLFMSQLNSFMFLLTRQLHTPNLMFQLKNCRASLSIIISEMSIYRVISSCINWQHWN